MKKSSMKSLVAYLNGETVTNINEIKSELEAELAKDEAKANANRMYYDLARNVVISHISDKPVTVAELFTACESDLPEGFTRSKMQYALNNYWSNDVVKIVNPKEANQYRRA